MPNTVILDPTAPNPYLFHADPEAPVGVFVTGDPVVYDDVATLTAADYQGRVEPEVLTVFAEGKFLRTLGRSIVTIGPHTPKPKAKAKAKGKPKPKAKGKGKK